jgi:Family of unknown function (DUF6247)
MSSTWRQEQALRPSAGGVTPAGMTAQPVSAGDPEDPAAILGLLPERWHEEFLAEYRQALEAAREVRRWPFLAELLHRWRLRVIAYSDPELRADLLLSARHGTRWAWSGALSGQPRATGDRDALGPCRAPGVIPVRGAGSGFLL